MKKRFLVAPVAAALLLSGLGATAAQASSVSYSNGGSVRITSTYASSAHRLAVYDAREDGWGGRSSWSTSIPAGGKGTLENSNGYGTSTTRTFAATGGQMFHNACAKNGSTTIGCSASASDAI